MIRLDGTHSRHVVEGHFDKDWRRVSFPHVCPGASVCAIQWWIWRVRLTDVTEASNVQPETERGRL